MLSVERSRCVCTSVDLPMSCLNESRVFDNIPRELRKGLAELVNSLSLHFEVTLLSHCGIPAKKILERVVTI